ncbi:MAG: redox-regulated ATPase YchF [Patescibacteria group bacterium]
MKIGIVGLPNVGKSTLFNALVSASQAEASNYPFCTIDPNIGIVNVPDVRLEKLTNISKSAKTIPAIVEFVDVAGLVAGAHKGEGLGNQFLSHIRECDAIVIVTRFFEDGNIIHVNGKTNPEEDGKIINLELILSDLSIVEKRLESLQKDIKQNDLKARLACGALEKIKNTLENEKPAQSVILDIKEQESIKEINLITLKPAIYIANVSESDAGLEKNELLEKYKATEYFNSKNLIIVSAKIESDLNNLEETEKKEYLESIGLKESGLVRLIKEAYSALGLITYFTTGEKESRAWTIHKGSSAPQAAGVIHTDFERGFIAADICKYDDFINSNGWQNAKEKGLVKTQGKDYIFEDGDITIFKFNVNR